MQTNSLKKLIKQRDELLSEISQLTQILQGSWLERFFTCSRKGCKCHSGQRHGPNYCLVVNENGKQRQKYIPQTKVAIAQNGIAQYKRLQEIVHQITLINLAIMKEDTEDESNGTNA